MLIFELSRLRRTGTAHQVPDGLPQTSLAQDGATEVWKRHVTFLIAKLETLCKSLSVTKEIADVCLLLNFPAFGALGLCIKYPTDCDKRPLLRMEQLRCGSAMLLFDCDIENIL